MENTGLSGHFDISQERFIIKYQQGNKQKNISIAAHQMIDNQGKKIKYTFLQRLNHKINYIKINVKTEEGIKQILMNVNSLGKKLLYTKTEKKKLQNDAKEAAVTKEEGKTTVEEELNKRIALYPYIKPLAKYEEDKKTKELISKKDGSHTGLTRETLLKVLIAASDTQIDPSLSSLISVNKEKYEVIRTDQGKVHVLDSKSISILGKGGYGIAYQVMNLTSGKMEVIKKARLEHENLAHSSLELFQNRAKDDLINEYNSLKKIHSNDALGLEIKERIQNCPRCFTIISGGGTEALGILERKHLQDANQAIKGDGLIAKLAPEKRRKFLIKEAALLTKAIKFFKDTHLVHSDIKDKNMYVDIDKNGELILKLGDFGGARFVTPTKMTRGEISYVYTPAYFIVEDERAISDAKYKRDANQYEDFQNKHDLHSLAATMFKLMTGSLPYRLSKTTERPIYPPNWKQSITDQLTSLGYDLEVCGLMIKMLEPDIRKRISSDEAAKAWDAMISSANPTPPPKDPLASFSVIIADCDRSEAEIYLNSVLNNPEISKKECFLIRPSSNTDFLAISYISEDKSHPGQYVITHSLITINQENQTVRLSIPGGKHSEIPFNEITKNFGTPVNQLMHIPLL